ncbi:hypothetical protein D3C87_2027530 [compost metagenome]
MGFAGRNQRMGPFRNGRTLVRLHLVMQVGRQLFDVARQHGEVDDADRGEFVLALDRGQRILEADDTLFQTAT